ncbi:MAG: restriction endonuclease subunit S, partial [Lachnospiraceae bacterium]|nr:restriction endonuclease subunit S [Lachnospiraceae bacterium]
VDVKNTVVVGFSAHDHEFFAGGMSMGRAMKDSGIDYIGAIPIDWDVIKLKYLMECLDGQRRPVDSALRTSGIYPYWGAGGIQDYVDDYLFDEDLVLLGEDGAPFFDPYRPVAFAVSGKVWVNNHIHVLRCVADFNRIFMVYGLNSVDYRLFINGSILNKLTQGNMREIVLCSPPLSEQNRIVDFLNEKCTKIDSIIEKTRAFIKEYKRLKQVVITQAVTKGVRGGRSMKNSGIAWIGEIPAEWGIYRVANLYEERNEPGSDELPVLMVSIHSGVSDDEVKDEDRTRKALQSEDKSKYKRVYPGDLVYNMMRAWQGAFGAVRVDGLVSPAYVVAKPKVPLDTRYIEALFRTPSAIEEMRRYSYGITDFRLRLYWQYFKNIRFCLPDIEEQKEIASYIDDKCAEIDALITKKEQLLTELENYKKSLIYEYVTGKKEVPS